MTTILPSTNQLSLWGGAESSGPQAEDPRYLSQQLITYLGNKRSLLPLIDGALAYVQDRLGKDKLRILDAFAGSGVVSRYFKQHASYLASNDLERYARVIGLCYLSNRSELDMKEVRDAHEYLVANADHAAFPPGIIRQAYSPQNDDEIQPGERVFYTARNATLLDNFRRLIENLPEKQQCYFLSPLLSEASVHANTSGVFKGYYKNSKTGIGQFGGNGKDALSRITSDIRLPFPIHSRFESDWEMYQEDANDIVRKLGGFDVAYFDPPYNQHPYGSNYFMLNLLVDYQKPQEISRVSGIPTDWNRSDYNKRRFVLDALADLFDNTDAKFVLLSYNDEGFVTPQEIQSLLAGHGSVKTFEQQYNTFRGCRNLRNRSHNVTEHLFLLERA